MNEIETNKFLMGMAYLTARNSLDPHRQVGAVITFETQILSYGWNGTPFRYKTNECKDADGNTLPEVVHAEVNAIAKAAAYGVSTQGATMYSTTVPCVECAKLIIQAGIKTVYFAEDYNKCIKGKQLLLDCNIKLIQI